MWSNPQETADLVTFTENILNGKLHSLYSVYLRLEYLFQIKTIITNKGTSKLSILSVNSTDSFLLLNIFHKIFSYILIYKRA